MQARRGELIDVLEGGTGLVANLEGHSVGLITWAQPAEGHGAGERLPEMARAEIRAVAVPGHARGRGVGRALFEAAHAALTGIGVRSTWLVTTNDNAPAIHLYESLGYRLIETRLGAIDELRRTVRPSIPLIGHGGVEMHDELAYAKDLSGT